MLCATNSLFPPTNAATIPDQSDLRAYQLAKLTPDINSLSNILSIHNISAQEIAFRLGTRRLEGGDEAKYRQTVTYCSGDEWPASGVSSL